MPGHHLEGAADYLGLSEDELHEQLRDGRSLADIATAEGKSVEGLKQALLASAKERLDQAVEDGDITPAQRDELLQQLESKIDDLVNAEGLPGRPPRFGHRFGGPMMASPSGSPRQPYTPRAPEGAFPEPLSVSRDERRTNRRRCCRAPGEGRSCAYV